MSSNFFNLINKLFIFIFLFIILITLFYIPSDNYIFSDSDFIWPLPNNTYISSYFGKRVSPTAQASSYHSGIDIPAPSGTPIYAVCSGIVTFSSWGAGGGYTLVIENSSFNISVSYCHLSPEYIVHKNDIINKGQLISYVGPKNVYTIVNNPFIDSSGNPTNGATTGCHLHLTIKKDGIAVNPLNYISSSSSS